jgi:putative ABC transport system substrate-binding protein
VRLDSGFVTSRSWGRASGPALVALCLFASLSSAPALGARRDAAPARIGVLALDTQYCRNGAFLAGLGEVGYIEGRQYELVCRHAGGRYDRLSAAAAELVQAKPSVIVAFTHGDAEAAHAATKTIPIVMTVSGDPVAAGLVASMKRPGGNATGLSYYNNELVPKRLQLLVEMVPGIRRIALLSDPRVSADLNQLYLNDSRAAARRLGIEVSVVEVRSEKDFQQAFDSIMRSGAGAVCTLANRLVTEQAQLIADLARWSGLPVMHYHKHFPAVGGLASYGVDYEQLHRRMAAFVDKILKGAKPGDLPIEQPTRFEFVVNRATAQELGLKLPSAVLLRADQVIE